jgi:hypothetical protein
MFLVYFGGYIDYFYEKFTTPKASSMIIGDSRGMQGIQPSVIENYFIKNEYDTPIINYSFTIAQAHIGPLYHESILKKIDPSTKNGLFIIAINPWMLGSNNNNNNRLGEFKEKDTPPHNMTIVDKNPNFEYFLKNFNYFHFKGIFRKNSFLHKDGWLEERNLPKDSATFKSWKSQQLEIFKGFKENYKISDLRQKYLSIIIKDLKKFGEVYLIRTYIDKEMLLLENRFYPNFDNFISTTAKQNNIPYFNYTNEYSQIKFKTYDGHHINKYDGVIFTKTICDSISLSNSNKLATIISKQNLNY